MDQPQMTMDSAAIQDMFLDAAGTLLPRKQNVPPGTHRALQKFRERGILRIVAAGRHMSEYREQYK